MAIHLRPITADNWVEACRLGVREDQLPFTMQYFEPIAAEALCKTMFRPGGMSHAPFGIYEGEAMVGFFTLAHRESESHRPWLMYFFVDHRQQGKGYGRAALDVLPELARRHFPDADGIRLTVHPENEAAKSLYLFAGYRVGEETSNGFPVYFQGF